MKLRYRRAQLSSATGDLALFNQHIKSKAPHVNSVMTKDARITPDEW